MDSKTVNYLKNIEREEEKITDINKIEYVIKKYLKNETLFIRGFVPPMKIHLESEPKEGIIEIAVPTGIVLPDFVSIYSTLTKQIEVSGFIKKRSTGKVSIEIAELKIAKSNRKEKRFYPQDNEIQATNFHISKNRFDLNSLSYSVSNRVIFHEFERKLSIKIPNLKIVDLNPTSNEKINKMVKKYNKGFFVTDCNDESCFSFENEDFLKFQEFYQENWQAEKQLLLKNSIKSSLIKPIRYSNLKREVFPIGYFQIKTTDHNLTIEDYENLKDQEKEIRKKIIDANLTLFDIKIKVLNISSKGMLIQVENKELGDLLIEREDLTFILLTKMQKPMPFYGTIKHIRKTKKDSLLVGISFEGTLNHAKFGITDKQTLMENLKFLGKLGVPYY